MNKFENMREEIIKFLIGVIGVLTIYIAVIVIGLITEENPTHIMVAFDKGKTFRDEKYAEYKEPEKSDDLEKQFLDVKNMMLKK